MWRKNPLALLLGIQAGAAIVKICMEVPQKVKNRTTLQSNNCTTGIYPKSTKILIQWDTYTWMFVAALSIIAKLSTAQVFID